MTAPPIANLVAVLFLVLCAIAPVSYASVSSRHASIVFPTLLSRRRRGSQTPLLSRRRRQHQAAGGPYFSTCWEEDWSNSPEDPCETSLVVSASQKTIYADSSGSLATNEPPRVTYADLTPLGRLVAGSVETAITVVLEYCSGLMGGYFFGVVTDIPRLLFRQSQEQPLPFWKEVGGRCSRMHQKSVGWALNYASISATFGAMKVITKVVRGGVEDDWNTVFSSMAAGAFFARAEGPRAMLQGAVLYGGLVYLLYGGAMSKNQPFQYKEQPVEF